MAKQNPQKRKTNTFYVALPEGIKIPGYSSMNLTGKTEAVSKREAVSHLIARQLSRDRDKIALIINELDVNYGGAENYAFSSQLESPEVLQNQDDLKKGSRLSSFEKRIMQEHALAYNLAVLDRADTSNPQVQMDYLNRARFLMKRH